jgi:hypothetical protein
VTFGRVVEWNGQARWDWKAREHATGLIHGIWSSNDSAITWCSRHIVVRWDNWTEMPLSAIVNCVYCALKMPG